MAFVSKKLFLLKSLTSNVLRTRRCVCSSKILWNEENTLEVENQELLAQSLYLEPIEQEKFDKKNKPVSFLEKQEVLEDVSHVGPDQGFRAFNFAAYVNHSPVIKKLVDLGVDFHHCEQQKYKPFHLLKLNMEDITPYIEFLMKQGVAIEDMGTFITRNPFIFLQDLNDLQIRINYLESKKFRPEEIAKILTKNPSILNMSTKLLDLKLGNFQRVFRLQGYQVRLALIQSSTFVNFAQDKFRESLFEIKDVNEFTEDQCKEMVVKCPPIFYTIDRDELKQRVEYLLYDMCVPRDLIATHPKVLRNHILRIKHRHLYLKSLGRAQYDPKLPIYVPLDKFCLTSDADFCLKIAKTTVETFNLFLKTM